MANFSEFTFPSSDGQHQIHCSQWLPDEGRPKAVVQIVHGISEYVGRYDQFARFLADHGYAVCGEDHLGHGRTGKQDSIFGFFAATMAGPWPPPMCAACGGSWVRSSPEFPTSFWDTPWVLS